MHQDIVIRLPVVSHQAQHFELDVPVPNRCCSKTEVALLTRCPRIWNTHLKPTGIPLGSGCLELSNDKRDSLCLGVCAKSALKEYGRSTVEPGVRLKTPQFSFSEKLS
jgi:hypothetical protein